MKSRIVTSVMKGMLLSLFLLSAAVSATAAPRENYAPYLKEGRVWEYVFHHFEFKDEYNHEYEEQVSTVRYIQRGDTTIGDREYCKFYRQDDSGSTAQHDRYDTVFVNPGGGSLYDGRPVLENFFYDSMDRLVNERTTCFNTTTNAYVSYGPDGNILTKTSVGSYTYDDTGRPHAVLAVSNPNGGIPAAELLTSFNELGRIASIVEGDSTTAFTYGPDMERWRTVTSDDGVTRRTIRYAGDCEKVTEDGVTRMFYYLDHDIVVMKQGDSVVPMMAVTDHQGSILMLVDANGITRFSAEYDAWGRQTVTRNDIAFQRGYTGHEMMSEYGLINMNGRLYDPVTARFLSPDNYIQQPTNSQNFNRYSYCLNNPLKYTDPSGEWFGLDDLLVAGVSFAIGYLSNAVSSGNWGWKSVRSGLSTAVMSWLGYNTAGLSSASGAITSSTWKSIGSLGVNSIVNNFIPSMTIPLGSHFSFTLSPAFAFGDGGFAYGVFGSLSYSNGDFVASIGSGFGNQFSGWNISAMCDDFGLGYARTYYNEVSVKGNTLASQYTGTITIGLGRDLSIDYSNDRFGAFKGDHDRTSALEFSYKDWTIGSFITTNNGRDASNKVMIDKEAPLWGSNPYKEIKDEYIGGAWANGKVYSAPLWIGYKTGNHITRIGYSHPSVQNITQNYIHKYIVKTPYFLDYSRFYTGMYSYYGFCNPLNMY